MPYKKQIAKKAKAAISENVRIYLLTGEREKGDAETFMLAGNWDHLEKVWNACKSEIIRDWIKKTPCTRPWPWWEFDAPQEPVKCWTDMDIKKAQRKRLEGVGSPDFEFLAYMPHFQLGIPTGFIDQFDVAYYNGKAKDIHGKRINSGFKKGDFKAVAYDKNNPPIFESEAVYLERLNLLTPIEKVFLTEHPELMEPEIIEFENDDD